MYSSVEMAAFIMLLIGITIATSMMFQVIGDKSTIDESKCYSKFDYDYKLMQKLSELETKQKELSKQLVQQTKVIDDLQNKLQDSVQAQWREWTTWSKCTFSCTGQDGGRLQTRDRTRSTTCGDTQSETESRPCNAVQFAKCIKDEGVGDDYAVAYDYKDTVGVAACTAMNTESSTYTFPVRRRCSNQTVSCAELCTSLGFTCFNALHIYSPADAPALAREEVGKKSVFTARYNSCLGSFCGPNYCCCRTTSL